jgi:hypothetical protein
MVISHILRSSVVAYWKPSSFTPKKLNLAIIAQNRFWSLAKKWNLFWGNHNIFGENFGKNPKSQTFVKYPRRKIQSTNQVRTFCCQNHGPLLMMARERTETRLNNWSLLTSSAMLCFAYNLFCVLLTAWKEWWQIQSIQFLFCHTHCLLSCDGGNSCMVLLPHDKESIQLGKTCCQLPSWCLDW